MRHNGKLILLAWLVLGLILIAAAPGCGSSKGISGTYRLYANKGDLAYPEPPRERSSSGDGYKLVPGLLLKLNKDGTYVNTTLVVKYTVGTFVPDVSTAHVSTEWKPAPKKTYRGSYSIKDISDKTLFKELVLNGEPKDFNILTFQTLGSAGTYFSGALGLWGKKPPPRRTK